jgi:hypothetical protein
MTPPPHKHTGLHGRPEVEQVSNLIQSSLVNPRVTRLERSHSNSLFHPAVALIIAALGLWSGDNSFAQSTRPGMGATPYADALGTGVTFRVWSPHANSVAVRGSFNGWGTTTMVEEGSSDIWSVDVP